jgi:hypothetical protein
LAAAPLGPEVVVWVPGLVEIIMAYALKCWAAWAASLPILAAAACSAIDGSQIDDGAGASGSSAGGAGAMGQGGLGFGSGSGGNIEEQGCAETVAEPTVIPVSMFIAVDKSGSMGGDKWDDTKAAFTSFFVDPAADGLKVALRFWPQGACDEDSCNVAACAQPQIALGSLADVAHESALVSLFNQTDPDGATPMSAALAGATQWAQNQQQSGEGAAEKVVVILVTDGSPNGCDENINTIAAIAGQAYQSADVLTFAVGLQGSNENDIDAIALAGGTQAGFFIGSGNAQAELLAALKSIQETAVACTFAMPQSDDPTKAVDPKKVNVTYTATGGSAPVTLAQVNDAAACTATGGWYYDDPNDPAIITLCASTCDAVHADDGASLSIVLGCATVVN